MKAAVVSKYGSTDFVEINDIEKPEIGKEEILVKVHVAAVTSADSRIRRAKFPKGFTIPAKLIYGINRPRIKTVGCIFSGVVEQVGSAVTHFAVGDEVCGSTGLKMGAHAEYLKIKESKAVVKKPSNISHEDAAGIIFGGLTALYFLRDKLKVGIGENILVNGGSGAVGTNAIQIAKLYGGKVTAVTSGKNAELVKSLGATEVIDYINTDVASLSNQFDVVLDTVGNIPIKLAKKLLTPNGRAALIVASLWETITARGNIIAGPAPEKKEDIEELLNLVGQEKLKVLIDSRFSLDDIKSAYAQADSGHKVGNILISMT